MRKHPDDSLPPEDVELLPARVGRDEINLAEFPFALISEQIPKDKKTIECFDSIVGKDKKQIQRKWTVTGSDKFGLPTAIDEIVYVVLMEITKEYGFQTRQVPITRYQIIKKAGWPDTLHYYRRVQLALDRLAGVTIKAEKAFWDNEKRSYVDVVFHILDNYVLYDEQPGKKTSTYPRTSFIVWNEVLFASMKARYLKQLDVALFLNLNSYLARRLYRYLDMKRYDGKTVFAINLEKLAFDHLGMSRPSKVYPSQIKQKLDPAHQELKDKWPEFKDWQYKKGKQGTIVVYYFASWPSITPEPGGKLPPSSTEEQEVEETLVSQGITRKKAKELVGNYSPEEIKRQVEYLPYREAKDPAAMLIKAIEENWAEPHTYRQAKRKKAREAKARAEREAREKKAAAEKKKKEALAAQIRVLKEHLNREEMQFLLEEALAKHSPTTRQMYEAKGLTSPICQALIAGLLERRYLSPEPGEEPTAQEERLQGLKARLSEEELAWAERKAYELLSFSEEQLEREHPLVRMKADHILWQCYLGVPLGLPLGEV